MKKQQQEEKSWDDALSALAANAARETVKKLKYLAIEKYNAEVLKNAIATLEAGCEGAIAEQHKRTLGVLAKIASSEGKNIEDVAESIIRHNETYIVCYCGPDGKEHHDFDFQPENEL